MDETTANGYHDRTIGRRLRRIRHARGKSLRVIAGLAGVSVGHLSEIENGLTALDRRSLIVALANALEIAPSELTALPIPAPANGETDSAVEAVRQAVIAASYGVPDGQVRPAEVLRARVTATVGALCRCEQERQVGSALPSIIGDLHASTNAGRDVAELLELTAWLHTQATAPWLSLAGAPVDLRFQAVLLGRDAAEDRDAPAGRGLVAAASARVMLAGGAHDLARTVLDTTHVPTNTLPATQLAGFLAMRRSVVAASEGHEGHEVNAPLEQATELAARTGEGLAYGLGFGPIAVELYRMASLLELGDYERAAAVAEDRINLDVQMMKSRRAAYWCDYGRALARIPGRRDEAVGALRWAELISPHRIQRGPVIREVLAELPARSPKRDDAIGRELRGMAYRAGLAV